MNEPFELFTRGDHFFADLFLVKGRPATVSHRKRPDPANGLNELALGFLLPLGSAVGIEGVPEAGKEVQGQSPVWGIHVGVRIIRHLRPRLEGPDNRITCLGTPLAGTAVVNHASGTRCHGRSGFHPRFLGLQPAFSRHKYLPQRRAPLVSGFRRRFHA